MVVIYRHGIRLTSRRERNHESGCRAVIVRQETLQREFTECFDAEVISTLPKKKRWIVCQRFTMAAQFHRFVV